MELQTVPVGKLRANPFNPRRTFEPTGDDDLSIKEMASQMRHDGVLQPLLVRPTDGGFQLAAGERRRRAAEIAGLREVPVIVRKMDDATMRRLAVVENIHRLQLRDEELEDAVGKIWEEDFGGKKDADTLEEMAAALGMDLGKLRKVLRAFWGKQEEPALADRALHTGERASLESLREESPKAVRDLAQARAKGELKKDELQEIIPVIRGAPADRRDEIVSQVKKAAKTGRLVRQEAKKAAERYAVKGPKDEWQRLLNKDETLLNRVADLLSGVEKIADITFLELFETHDARMRALRVLKTARDRLDSTIGKAERATNRWKAEWQERVKELKGA
jgi:ParB/RepB/Spo0J family partition protein